MERAGSRAAYTLLAYIVLIQISAHDHNDPNIIPDTNLFIFAPIPLQHQYTIVADWRQACLAIRRQIPFLNMRDFTS